MELVLFGPKVMSQGLQCQMDPREDLVAAVLPAVVRRVGRPVLVGTVGAALLVGWAVAVALNTEDTAVE